MPISNVGTQLEEKRTSKMIGRSLTLRILLQPARREVSVL
jgi:hypothetical protein